MHGPIAGYWSEIVSEPCLCVIEPVGSHAWTNSIFCESYKSLGMICSWENDIRIVPGSQFNNIKVLKLFGDLCGAKWCTGGIRNCSGVIKTV
jgi:hypothetical protein